jgi:hypothetical protein
MMRPNRWLQGAGPFTKILHGAAERVANEI